MTADVKLLADMDALVAYLTDRTGKTQPPEVCDIPGTMRRAADALRRYVPPRLLDEHEVEKLARKVAMPKYMFDTSEARLYLASFFNQASIFISLPPMKG